MRSIHFKCVIQIFLLISICQFAAAKANEEPSSISSNPSAVNLLVGTGAIGKALGISEDSGVRLGAAWVGNINYLFCGGLKPHTWSGNSLFQLDLSIHLEKVWGWKGALFDVSALQFNGSPTNVQAGALQGYNNLPESPPLDRCELFQCWLRQELFDQTLIIRCGKLSANDDFTNILKPFLLHKAKLPVPVPATTGLIYTPILVIPPLLGIIPGYYNSAWGISAIWAPTNHFYIGGGLYDGNLARNKQTGLRGPQFNGYRFSIVEFGSAWGYKSLPGSVSLGAWYQSGKLTGAPCVKERGTAGVYLFGTQRLWYKHPGIDNSGILGFYQAGYNHSRTLPLWKFFGGGLTFFGLIPWRVKDSFGTGISWSRLNKYLFKRHQEIMFQGYYQAFVVEDVFFTATLSYIPQPGARDDLKSAWASSANLVTLF